jgi:cell division protein FtsQ
LVFGVDAVAVEGAVRLTPDEIRTAAHIESDQMLWNIDLSKVEANMSNLPWVRSVELKRVLPSTVEITVEERVPERLIQLADGRFVLMDNEGIFLDFREDRESAFEKIEIIEAPLDIQFGQPPLNIEGERWACLMEILRWKDTIVGETAFRLTALAETEMVFWLTDTLKVEVVDMNDGPYIVDMLARILTDLHRRGISAGTIHLEAGFDARFVQAE